MPRWTVPALAALVTVVLAAGALGVVSVDEDPAATSPAPRTSTSSSSTPSEPSTSGTSGPPTAPATAGTTQAPPPPAATVAAVVPSLQAFVEKERGLAFKRPVQVTLLADKAFEERAGESDEEEIEDLREAGAVLHAMGLLEPGVDLVQIVERLSATATLGFYDTETKELVVRGAEPTAFVRVVIVHELTHALEDQHFDLDREELGDEAFLGFQALIEGSASRIEDRYRASMPASERRQADRDERARSGVIPRSTPDVVRVIFGFPYAYGPALVRAILGAGGQARLDQAFARPPLSSEQVLDPPRYLRGDDPQSVPLPAADGTVFDDGEIGELFLSLMLRTKLDDDEADEAARGWGGDSYVAWKEGGRTCVRMSFVMDTPADSAQLTAALARWAQARGEGASADATSLRTCG